MSKIPLPTLNHPELNVFFNHDLNIPHDLVKPLFDLPRATLIEDLLTILEHANNRYTDYEAEGWDMKTCEFPTHALWMLADLKAEETLPQVLDFLGKDKEMADFWFGDSITEGLYEVIYEIGQSDYPGLKSFLLDEKIDEFVRNISVVVMEQIGLHQPEKRQEVIDWFADLLDAFIANADQLKKDEEWGTVTMSISGVEVLQAQELLPKVEKLYELDLIDESFYGNWKSFQKHFKEPINNKRVIHANIFERYKSAVTGWHYYRKVYDEDYKNERKRRNDEASKMDILPQLSRENTPGVPFIRTEKKVGRNDPCPCGSGRKYKKCCM